MPTLFDAYADLFRIATFQAENSARAKGRCGAGRRQLEAPQHRCPHRPAKLSWLA
ncbi:hypothetical protein [Aminobacter sp. Piv2-1]|uniref:hypothetical protein n=1 Tax=Aminobacter sp. Piv2-1 TaxID=3031122 RepID=UPI00309BF0B0